MSTQVGPDPVNVTCPHCHAMMDTSMEHDSMTMTSFMADLLSCFLCLPCICLSCCIVICRNADDYCPNCNAFIGTYQS